MPASAQGADGQPSAGVYRGGRRAGHTDRHHWTHSQTMSRTAACGPRGRRVAWCSGRGAGSMTNDDELMESLRRIAGLADPVPAPVAESARTALSTRRFDEELAALLTD